MKACLNLQPIRVAHNCDEERWRPICTSECERVCSLFRCPFARAHERAWQLQIFTVIKAFLFGVVSAVHLFVLSNEVEALFFDLEVHVANVFT